MSHDLDLVGTSRFVTVLVKNFVTQLCAYSRTRDIKVMQVIRLEWREQRPHDYQGTTYILRVALQKYTDADDWTDSPPVLLSITLPDIVHQCATSVDNHELWLLRVKKQVEEIVTAITNGWHGGVL